ncbi:TIM barrel protein [Flavitalea sp. BT771]|uniref:sugar phosphate isomerase/epimerase family protein n=1 Tax=Flavitalea sp. BT771 TaxID=3063329 RepID=UPI0026E130FF|nr:TIM barrel protein [Flavitalea sp. BT771]MDO6429370.1 TIM barrel protein [Flavitalea sp. BT771]MDV6218502.1 TIM barrel protein [Flavitalea sp. BT771]
MGTINRRRFLGRIATGAGAAFALSHLPSQLLANARMLDIPLGFQTFPIRDMLAKDFSGTLKMMAAQGYQLTEMCSPKGYADIGYGPLVSMKTSDMRKIISDAGLSCPSCHFGFPEFGSALDQSIGFAHDLGLSQMICSTFWLPKTATLNDYLAAADQLNRAAEKIKKAGMQTGFHNHDFEFHALDGQLIYDALMKRLDPELVKMQFQTEVINLGYKASRYFNKYPGRFISAHLSDWTADKKQVPVGQGVIDWKDFFAAARTGGVKNFFVEMDLDKYKDSAAYIHSL